MTCLQAVLLLSIGITLAVAYDPDCSRCEYYHGIGFLKHPHRCNAYVMCFKKPYSKDYFRYQIMCCPEETEWDEHHLTCKRNPKCTDPRDLCPNATTTTNLPCPFKKVDDDPYSPKYSYKATHEIMSCGYDSYFSEKLCTCLFQGPYRLPCWKILHYNFSDTYDSHSCYNFAVGLPYGHPPLTGDQLCLDGIGQYFYIPFLNNWWAWNPVARTFTICFWLRVKPGQTAGVFATNCYSASHDPVAMVWLDEGELKANLGGTVIGTGWFPDSLWNLICISFDNGHYTFFVNAVHLKQVWLDKGWVFKSHSDATLGFVDRDRGALKGYFDDFCFWTHDLFKPEIMDLYNQGPSNNDGTGIGDMPSEGVVGR